MTQKIETIIEKPEVEVPETEIAPEEQTQQPKAKQAKSEAFKPLPYFENATVTCACGNTFTTGSTREEIRVELCSNCHPFFTGQEKFVDTEGRVERFKRLVSSKKASRPKDKFEKKEDDRPKTLKEMLQALEKR
nr:50S ribosomal protein L31 [uncultured archaeon]